MTFFINARSLSLVCAATLALAAGAIAQEADSPSTKAFRAADDKMVQALAAPMDADADKAYVADMIAHDQGDIAIAQLSLRFGANSDLRKMAGDIISDRQKEIEKMKKAMR